MPPAGFETDVQTGERPQTYDLDRAATAINDMGTKEKDFLPLPGINRYYQMCTRKATLYIRCSNNIQKVRNNNTNGITFCFSLPFNLFSLSNERNTRKATGGQ